jgi:hypothetical protein
MGGIAKQWYLRVIHLFLAPQLGFVPFFWRKPLPVALFQGKGCAARHSSANAPLHRNAPQSPGLGCASGKPPKQSKKKTNKQTPGFSPKSVNSIAENWQGKSAEIFSAS